jgi:multidrug efflux pump subunit AcrB
MVMRLRPLPMTSIAFLLDVRPLMFSEGAGPAARGSLGTAVFGGMLVSTVLNPAAVAPAPGPSEQTRARGRVHRLTN